MAVGRYHRQEIFYPIGPEGQKKLQSSRVCIIGIGALGASVANMLAQAGVGYLRLIDRDIVELTNLQRQALFTEADVEQQLPKAEAAREHISQIQSYDLLPDFCGNLAIWFECGVPMDECTLSEFSVIDDPSVDGSRCHGKI